MLKEARLRGLGSNPVFRYLWQVNRRKTMGGRTVLLEVGGIALNWLIVALLVSMGGVNILIAVVLLLARYFGVRQKRFSSSICGIPPHVVSDLSLAGVKPEVIASGLWGYAASMRQLFIRRFQAGGFFCLGILLLFASEPLWPQLYLLPLSLSLVLLELAGRSFGMTLFHGESSLRMTRASVGKQRKAIQGGNELPPIFWGVVGLTCILALLFRFMGDLFSFPILILFIMAVGIGSFLITYIIDPLGLSLWQAFGLFVFIAATIRGTYFGFASTSAVEQNWQQLKGDIRFLMECNNNESHGNR